MGRPTKLNSDVQQTLAFALGEGATVEHACEFAGIAPRTFYNWIERGENGEEEFLQFVQTTTRARGQGIVTNLRTISKASEAGDWRAAAWRLAHCYPAEYGRKVKIQGDQDTPLRGFHEMAQEQLDARILQLWRQCGYDARPAAFPATTSETTPEDLR